MVKEEMRVRLDYANVMSENIGSYHGFGPDFLAEYQDQVAQIHHDFFRRRERGELVFLDLPFRKEMIDEIEQYCQRIAGRFENYVHLGIGGSALGPISLHTALCHPFYNLLPAEQRQNSPRMFFLDNIDPDTMAALLSIIDVRKTLFAVVTKSGGTAETLAGYLVCLEKLRAALGKDYRDHLVFITDPLRGFLRKLAQEERITSFAIDPAVGGRFSVLTPVGLLPAALAGIDINQLLDGAAYLTKLCQAESLFDNPAYLFGLLTYLYYLEEVRTIVMMPYSDRLYRVADWFCQLWAESLGKKNNRAGQTVNIGPLPVKALGATDQHSQVQLYMEGPNNKLFTFLEVADFDHIVPLHSPYPDAAEAAYFDGTTMNQLIRAEKQATEIALTENHRPNITFKLPVVNPFTVGQLLEWLELATAFAGELFDLNAFDQPGVEAGKIATYALMGRRGYEQKRTEIEQKLAQKQTYLL